MHANAYLKMCLHPMCVKKRMRESISKQTEADTKEEDIVEKVFTRYLYKHAKSGKQYKLHPLCYDHYKFMTQDKTEMERGGKYLFEHMKKAKAG